MAKSAKTKTRGDAAKKRARDQARRRRQLADVVGDPHVRPTDAMRAFESKVAGIVGALHEDVQPIAGTVIGVAARAAADLFGGASITVDGERVPLGEDELAASGHRILGASAVRAAKNLASRRR